MIKDDLDKLIFPELPEDARRPDRETLLRVYFNSVEMADRVSQRRQSANSFYLSINTAFLSAFYVFKPNELDVLSSTIVAVCGISLCVLWLRNILSYKDLNSGKFAVICRLEEHIGCAPYTAEWKYLKRGTEKSKYRPFNETERAVPIVFLSVFLFIFLRSLPWDFFSLRDAPSSTTTPVPIIVPTPNIQP
jgi:hypothetical protein